MRKNTKFAIQVVFLFASTFCIVFWLLNGGPMVHLGVKKLEPNPELPTFAKSTARSMANTTAEDVRQREFRGIGYTILTESARYEKSECDGELRRYLIGRINHFDRYQRRYPGIELENRGEVTTDTVERSINSLFLGSLLTLEEFPANTQTWLKTFARPGGREKIKYIKQCQARD